MNFVKRVVFDTSTLVSAVLRPGSVPRQAFLKAVAEAELCASASTLAELESVLGRDKFDRYLERETRLQFVALYRRHARLFPAPVPRACSPSPSPRRTLCRNPVATRATTSSWRWRSSAQRTRSSAVTK